MNACVVIEIAIMSLLSLEHYSERQRRSLLRIKEMMSAAAVRTAKQYQRLRQHPRKELQGTVFVRLPAPNEAAAVNDEPATFQVWAYDVSQSGIAFVSPEIIPQDAVTIGLKLPDGRVRWMSGRIVRSRPIPEEDFIDYGVKFQRSAT